MPLAGAVLSRMTLCQYPTVSYKRFAEYPNGSFLGSCSPPCPLASCLTYRHDTRHNACPPASAVHHLSTAVPALPYPSLRNVPTKIGRVGANPGLDGNGNTISTAEHARFVDSLQPPSSRFKISPQGVLTNQHTTCHFSLSTRRCPSL